MNLRNKYLLIQTGRMLLSLGCSATLWVVGVAFIRFRHFAELGFNMYPGIQVPKYVTIPDAVSFFYRSSIEPLLNFVALAVVADIVIRKYLLKIEFPN